MGKKFNKAQIQILLDNIVVLVDSREKKNNHIIDYLEKRGVKWETKKLDFGDYSCYIPPVENVSDTGIEFKDLISIERKANLDELANNLTRKREQFENEFERHKGKMILLVEGNSYADLLDHKYRSEYSPVSFNASLMTMCNRYGIEMFFLDEKHRTYAGIYILTMLRYAIREYLINLGGD